MGVNSGLLWGILAVVLGVVLGPSSVGTIPDGASLFATPEAATPGVAAAGAARLKPSSATPDPSGATCSAASGAVGAKLPCGMPSPSSASTVL